VNGAPRVRGASIQGTHIGMCGYRVTCAAPPTRPFPRPRRGRQAVGHSPVGSNNFRSSDIRVRPGLGGHVQACITSASGHRRCAVWLSWVRADLEVAATYRARRAVPDSCRLLTPASGERGDVGRPAMDRGEIITGMNRAYCSWPRVRLAVISASASRPARASGSAPAGGSIRAYFRWFRGGRAGAAVWGVDRWP
jgi:hypothetical protein